MQDWFNNLERRERYVLIGGALVLALMLLYLMLIEPLFSGVAERKERVAEKQALLSWIETQAETMPTPGAGSQRSVGSTSAIVTFGRAVDSAGLDPYLRESRPSGTTGVRVRFEGAPFDQLVQLVGQLNAQHGLEISTAAVERTRTQGTIDARLTLEVPVP